MQPTPSDIGSGGLSKCPLIFCSTPLDTTSATSSINKADSMSLKVSERVTAKISGMVWGVEMAGGRAGVDDRSIG